MTEVCRDCRGSGIAYSEYHPLSDDHEHIRCESCDGFGTEQGKPMTKKPTSAERDALKSENDRLREIEKELKEYYIPTLKFNMDGHRKTAMSAEKEIVRARGHAAANAFETCIGCIEEALKGGAK